MYDPKNANDREMAGPQLGQRALRTRYTIEITVEHDEPATDEQMHAAIEEAIAGESLSVAAFGCSAIIDEVGEITTLPAKTT